MFDKFVVADGRNQSMYVSGTIDEHRAPTDESVRLLNEMQEKAMKNILSTVNLNNNILNIAGIFIHRDCITDKIAVFGEFKLNGIEYSFHEEVHPEFRESLVDLLKKIVNQLSYKITELLIEELVVTSEFEQMVHDFNKNGNVYS